MITKKTRLFKVGLLANAVALSLAFSATAKTATTSQDLGSVLNQFATQANVEIMFSPQLVAKRSTYNDDFSGLPRQDLDKILSGTGLTFEEPSQNVFIIKEEQQANLAPGLEREALSNAAPNLQASNQSTQSSTQPSINRDAPTGVIIGVVLDELSGQALAGALVKLEGTDNVTSTDTRGQYRFAAAPTGQYSISVSYLGNEPQTRRVNVDSGEATTQNFTLSSPVETVVVYGNRSSLQQALNQQRAAANSAAIVASDLLGSFPAETLSEALRRVSGVTFSRDANSGEGDRISVRGFNEQAINIQLNGVDLQGTGTDRSVDLSGFLTDNIKQVTIQKSLLPSQEASGSGGLVEVETRSGLDYGDKYFRIAGEFERPSASGFGDEFEISTTGAIKLNDDLGLSATLQYRETEAQNYNVNFLQTITQVLPEGFTSLFRVPESFDYPFDSAFDTPLYTGATYTARQRDESNLTMSFNVAYDWSDHTNLRLDVQSIQNETDLSNTVSLSAFSAGSIDMPIPELNDDIRRRTYLRRFSPSLSVEDRFEDLSTQSISFRGETNLDNWEFNYTVGLSKIEKQRKRDFVTFASTMPADVASLINPSTIVTNPDDDPNMTQRVVGGAVGFAGNGAPFLSLSELGREAFVNPENYYASFASLGDVEDSTDISVFEISARRYFDNSVIDYIEIGTKYDDRERNNSDDALSTTNIISTKSYSRVLPTFTPISTLNSDGISLLNLHDIGLSQALVPRITPGSGAAFINSIDALTFDDPNTPENEARFNLRDRTSDSPIDEAGAASPATISEEILAAYIETKLIFGDVEVIGGVRYQEETRSGITLSAPSILLDEPGIRREPRATFVEAGLIDFVDVSGVQETWTPSLVANYRPTEQIVIRGAYFRSTVNPSIDKLARPRQISIDLRPNFANAVIREANPDLEPSKTDNYDLDFSYYFEDNPGLVRLGLFYKEISNNFTNTLVSDEAAGLEIREQILSELAPLNSINPELLAIPDNADYFLSRPQNGEGGEIYGAEIEIIRQLDFLPESWPKFLNNFSVLGNATYTKSDFEDLESARSDEGDIFNLVLERPLLGQSEWAGNASVRYEDGPFSGSIIYTYQSSSAAGYDEYNLNTIVPEFDTLDLRMSYTFKETDSRPQVILFFEGDDVLRDSNEADIRRGVGSEFGDGDVSYFFPTQMQFNGGRRFTIGASVRF